MKTEKNLTAENSQSVQGNSKFLLTSLPTNLLTRKSFGFTLAEVLITLAVVGVVAALTMPGLINNFRIKDLEARFKKADAMISQAMQTVMFENGFNRYYDFSQLRPLTPQYAAACSDESTMASCLSVVELFRKQFEKDIIDSFDATEFNKIARKRKITYYKFGDGTKSPHKYSYPAISENNSLSVERLPVNLHILKNGMAISDLRFTTANVGELNKPGHIYGVHPFLFFDTNGPFKGPNRLGYDMFFFSTMACSFTSCNPLSEGWKGCNLKARADQNPIDSSKSYWKSLYKPKSYWENLQNSQ